MAFHEQVSRLLKTRQGELGSNHECILSLCSLPVDMIGVVLEVPPTAFLRWHTIT